MRFSRLLAGVYLAACLLIGNLSVSAQDAAGAPSGQAVLRCDPGMQVLSIDGDKKRRVSLEDLRLDCNVPLVPGKHRLVARFDWEQVERAVYKVRYRSPGDQSLEFDVTAERIYRLRGRLLPEWKAWIEDVTSQEGGLPSNATQSKTWRKSLPAELRASTVVMKISPSNTFVGTYYGRTQGPWFYPRDYVPIYIKNEDWARDDYAIGEVDAGAVLGIANAIINGNAFALDKQYGYLCSDMLTPVFENLAGGKVYFLGNFSFAATPSGLDASYTQTDLDAAREFLRTRRPELAAALEPANYRMMRGRAPCEVGPAGRRWRNVEPGSLTPSPAASSAGSK